MLRSNFYRNDDFFVNVAAHQQHLLGRRVLYYPFPSKTRIRVNQMQSKYLNRSGATEELNALHMEPLQTRDDTAPKQKTSERRRPPGRRPET
jgi:hypothetical protein